MHARFEITQFNQRTNGPVVHLSPSTRLGWSGGAMVLGKLPVPGRPTIWIIVGQGPIALAGGAGGGCLSSILFLLFLPFFGRQPDIE